MGKAKIVKKAKSKKTRKSQSVMVTELSPKAKAIIKALDALETMVADSNDAIQEKLPKLLRELDGGFSFDHPGRGPMCIMHRGHYFWRAKPQGGPKGPKPTKAATKKVVKILKKKAKRT